jgi:hypothetical protein
LLNELKVVETVSEYVSEDLLDELENWLKLFWKHNKSHKEILYERLRTKSRRYRIHSVLLWR